MEINEILDNRSAWWCDDVRYGLCPCGNNVVAVKKDLTVLTEYEIL